MGVGTRRVRKPTVLAILRRIWSEGIEWTGWHFDRHAAGVTRPKKITAHVIAEVLLEEFLFPLYMADEYNPDDRNRSTGAMRNDDELRRFRETERDVRDGRAVMRLAMGLPLGDRAMGDTDGFLQWRSGTRAERASALRRELGVRFIEGPPALREAMVRDWIRKYREQGRLPPGPPPLRV